MKTDHDDGFPSRMAELIKRVGNVTALAKKAHISRRVIDNYKAGLADPSRARLIALAAAGDVSVEWLVTGKGAMIPGAAPSPSSGIDKDLLAQTHKGVAELYRSENARVSADVMASDVARIYDDLVATYDNAGDRVTGLKLMLTQLRRELRAPPAPGSANSKQAS